MLSRDEFAHYVKSALHNFYDPVHLQNHPLAGLLGLQRDPGETRGEALRKLLRETIELLKPKASIAAGRSEWFGYRVLWLRYVRSLSQAETCQELSISEASFFRRQREALDAVVSILWERYQQTNLSVNDQATEAVTPSSFEQAMERAIALVSSGAGELVDLDELLKGIRKTIQLLAEQQRVVLRMDVPSSLPMVYGDPSVLRQIFLNVLAEGIKFASGNVLELGVSLKDDEMIWQLGELVDLNLEQDIEGQSGIAISRNLLSLYGGRLWLERDAQGIPTLLFTLRIPQPGTILVIDDDPGALALYRRYLQNQHYLLLAARTA